MALITSLGVGSGLELQSMLEQLKQNEKDSFITLLENKKTGFNNQLTAFNSITQNIFSIKSDALNLSLSSNYLGRKAEVGNSSVINANVSDGTNLASYQLNVSRIATKSSWLGEDGLESADSVVSASGGVLSFTVGSGDQIDVSVGEGATIEDLADAINAKNAGVTASVVNTGESANSYKLAITANNTGESSRISILSQLGDYTLEENQGAGNVSLNAELTINGVTYQRNSNSNINDIISGLTLNLSGTGDSTLDIQVDNSNLKDTIKGFVEKFNTLVTDINSKTGIDDNGDPRVLNNSLSVKNLIFDVNNLLSSIIDTGGTITSMVDIGLDIAKDGTISIDETKLDSALDSNFDDVKNFFVGTDDYQGFAEKAYDKMNSLTNLASGILALEENSLQTNIDRTDKEIESANARLDKKFSILEKQFQQLDIFMNSMSSLGDYLTSQFNSLSGNTSNK